MFLFTNTAAQSSDAGSSDAIVALHDFKTIQYASIALVTLYAWDFVLTFPREVETWKTGFKVPKLLFLFNRYFSLYAGALWLFTNLKYPATQHWCYIYQITSITSDIIAWLAGEIILLCHLFAVFSFDRFVVIPVTALFVVSSGMYMGGDIAQLFIGQVLEPKYGLCQIKEITTLSFLSCVPIMTTDLALVIIIGWKTVRYHLEIMDSSWSGASLLKTLARGAFLFYLGTFMTTLLALFLFFTHPGIVGIAGGSLFTLVPMAVNHLVLGLRETVMDQAYGDPALVATVSMQFGV